MIHEYYSSINRFSTAPASLLPDVWYVAGPTWCFTDAAATIACADGDAVFGKSADTEARIGYLDGTI
jgi:hypothetical protein